MVTCIVLFVIVGVVEFIAGGIQGVISLIVITLVMSTVVILLRGYVLLLIEISGMDTFMYYISEQYSWPSFFENGFSLFLGIGLMVFPFIFIPLLRFSIGPEGLLKHYKNLRRTLKYEMVRKEYLREENLKKSLVKEGGNK